MKPSWSIPCPANSRLIKGKLHSRRQAELLSLVQAIPLCRAGTFRHNRAGTSNYMVIELFLRHTVIGLCVLQHEQIESPCRNLAFMYSALHNMTTQQFTQGDVVRLKGQNQSLTVLSVSGDIVNVVWEANGIHSTAIYQQGILELVPPRINVAEINRLARIRENETKRKLRGF